MELMVPLENGSDMPYYQQIYLFLKKEIQQGNLAARVRLPSTRLLAEHLKVSRSTTQMAYDQLISEGYIESVPCKGYYVSSLDGMLRMEPEPGGTLLENSPGPVSQYEVDFSPRGIDLNSFPFQTWRRLSKNTFSDANKEMFLSGDPQGEPALRQAIRSYLHSARGVNCSPDQLIIGAGSEYLWMLLGQILGRKRRIAMENPTYRQAYRVFRSLGYEVKPVSMDRHGMEVEQLEESRADIAYIMPSHQYPTGIVMPVKRRQELLSWAARGEDRYLIEDDYDSEFRYKGKPIPALQGMDREDRVIYIGTFSKSIAPAIRIGYLVLPPALLAVYRDRLSFYSSTVPRIDQNILYQFLVEGHYERHLNRMRALYKGKHDILLSALKPLEKSFTIGGELAGLHLLLTHKGGGREQELIDQAKSAGVRVYGMSGYLIDPAAEAGPATLILGFANLTEEEILKGAALLAQVWKEA
ncbi:MAG: PLP-dependent aminotransferase family protein [Lachnospiraceae bacterium]